MHTFPNTPSHPIRKCLMWVLAALVGELEISRESVDPHVPDLGVSKNAILRKKELSGGISTSVPRPVLIWAERRGAGSTPPIEGIRYDPIFGEWLEYTVEYYPQKTIQTMYFPYF